MSARPVPWFALLAFTLLGNSPLALAAEPVRFQYAAPAGCPTEADFLSRVRERSTHLELAAAGELARSFSVTIRLDPDSVFGRVEFVDADGASSSRAVRGQTCDEVVSGIALVTALAVDARNGDSPETPAPVAKPPPAPVAMPPPAATPPPAHAAPASPESAAWSQAGFGGGFIGWAGPNGGVGLDAYFAHSFREAGPSLRLSAWHWRASGSSDGHVALFRAWGARLEGCPLSLVERSISFEPCLGTNLGLFRGEGVEGSGVTSEASASVFWRDVLLVGRMGATIAGFVVIEAQAELELPLFRQDFGFTDQNGQPNGTVFSVPAVSGGAELHVGVRFP